MIQVKKTFILVLLSVLSNAYGQSDSGFSMIEERINNKALSIVELNRNEDRIKENRKVYQLLLKALEKEGSYYYPFDSLETISGLSSPDDRFRIFSWYIPLTDGHYRYFGFIQVKDAKDDKMSLHELHDKSQEIDNPENKVLDNNNWFGAYYYELIHYEYSGKNYYTLLGWRGNNPLIRHRVIEPISFSEEGFPLFGKNCFDYNGGDYKRIVFRYSARVSMSLTYDTVFIEGRRERRSRQVKIIVFNQLMPVRESLQGHYQFYKPEDIFNGFVFENGNWVFMRDVDVRVPGQDIAEPRRLEELFENER